METLLRMTCSLARDVAVVVAAGLSLAARCVFGLFAGGGGGDWGGLRWQRARIELASESQRSFYPPLHSKGERQR